MKSMRPWAFVLLCVPISLHAETSALWGESGESWDPAGRLADFSWAGYRSGEAPIPDYPVVARVTDFGAVTDDEGDDTEAFQRAVQDAPPGAILVPAGRYLLTDRVSIRRPGLVLRGEGPGQTVLFFPHGLEHIDPKPTTNSGGRELSGYSWSDGFLGIRGEQKGRNLSAVAASARRGENRITVEDPTPFSSDMEIMIEMRDDAGKSLVDYLYAGDAGDTSMLKEGSQRARQVLRVTAVEGNVLSFDRPLRYDVRPEWKPMLRSFEPSVAESGIESLTIEFPARAYGGHFTEVGYNGMVFANVRDCWVRDVEIVNADSGLFASSWFCTFQGMRFRTTEDAVAFRGDFGHHGIMIGQSDNLVTDFDFQHRMIHDLTVSSTSAFNVFSNGGGVDLCFDHHKRAPHGNLFTNLDAGAGTRLWRSGGGANLGRHCAAWTTFWGIRTENPVEIQRNWSPSLVNYVGLNLSGEAETTPDGRWVEPLSPTELAPRNLHEAQLARRLAAPNR